MANSNKKCTDLIKLNGTIIKEDGQEYKSNFFKFLDLLPDDYSDIVYTKEEASKIRSHLMHLATGASAAIPLKCGGAAVCPFAGNCPFVKLDRERRKKDPGCKLLTPIGRNCLVEINLLNEWTRLFIEEYEVNEHNFTDFQQIRELAENELMLWRLNNNLAKPEHAELIQETVVGVDKQGNPLTRMEVNALFEAKERLQNRKTKLIKLMVGDRQEKYKRDAALRKNSGEDPSSNAAQLRSDLNSLMRRASKIDIGLKEAEGRVIDAEVVEEEILTPESLIDEEE